MCYNNQRGMGRSDRAILPNGKRGRPPLCIEKIFNDFPEDEVYFPEASHNKSEIFFIAIFITVDMLQLLSFS